MKNILLLLILSCSVMGCRKTDQYIPTGHITVFTMSDAKKYRIVIDDIEQIGYVAFTDSIPNCGDAGCRSFELSSGEHKIVTLDSAYFWRSEQHILVTHNGCTNVQVP